MPKVDMSKDSYYSAKDWYRDFLSSEEWFELREKRKEVDGYKCRICGCGKNLVVHHLTYENGAEPDMDDLITVCKDCHRYIHADDESTYERRRSMFPLAYCDKSKALDFALCGYHTETGRGNSWDEIKASRTEFAEIIQVDPDSIRIADTQKMASAIANFRIDNAIRKEGESDSPSIESITKRSGMTRQKVLKRIRRLKEIGGIMPRIDMNDYNSAEESQGGGFKQLVPGAYVVRIQAVRTEWYDNWNQCDKNSEQDKMAWFVFDIAEGEFAGEFSRDFYMKNGRLDPNKDFLHQAAYAWYNVGKLKLFNRVLAESNPGFDPMAAFNADRWEMYVGKLFGVVLNGTVTTNDNGYDQWRLRSGDIISVNDVRTGNHKEPKITDKRTKVEDPQDFGNGYTADPYGNSQGSFDPFGE